MSKNYYNFCLLTISRLLILPIVFSLQIYTLSFNHFVGSTPLSQIISHVQFNDSTANICVLCPCSASDKVTQRTKGLTEFSLHIKLIRLQSIRMISDYLLFILYSGILEYNVSQLKTTHIF